MVTTTLLGLTFLGALGALLWWWRREQRLVDTDHGLRCPLHGSAAQVTVRTDPRAPSCRQHVRVANCSLLSDAAVALPERSGYLPDAPPYKVRLHPALPYPVHATEVSCPQHCVLVLNETASGVTLPPLDCTSGTSDSMNLVRQTVRNPRISELLHFYGA